MSSFEEHMSPEEWKAWKKKVSKPPKRKMPKKGSLITIIHDETDDLSRIKAIIERYNLKVEFRLVKPSRPS